MSFSDTYSYMALRSVDLFLAAIFWWHRRDYPGGLTISTHCLLAMLDGKAWGAWGCRMLGRIEKGHCLVALQSDLADAEGLASLLEAALAKIQTQGLQIP